MKYAFDIVLDQIRETAEMPPQASLYYLSSLGKRERARLGEAWPELPVELRERMVRRLTEMAEADFELDFGAVFRLGLEDENPEVRAVSIEGLWEDQDVRLVPALAERLRQDENVTVRAAAATSLGRFVLLGELQKIRPQPHTLAYETLLACCQDPEECQEVQRRAMESLSYADNQTVVGLIREAYDAPGEKMRISAVFAMGRSADTRWADQVQQELFSPNPALRYEAARACGELQLSESVDRLEELMEDVDIEVQEATLWALGQIGGHKARQILESYCEAENEALRTAAEAAMAELQFLHGDLSELFDTLADRRQ